MTTISWNILAPSNTSKVGLGPKDIRSVWTAVDTGLNHSDCPIYWSVASRGEARPGGFRTYYGARSLLSNDGSQDSRGRLFFASDESHLLVLDSDGTWLAGSRYLMEHDTAPAAGRAWVEELYGVTFATADQATTKVTTLLGTFAAAPLVTLAPAGNQGGGSIVSNYLYTVTASTTTNFTSEVTTINGATAISLTLTYRAVGQSSSTGTL